MMTAPYPTAMADVLRLTRAGSLAEATAQIRAALAGGGAPSADALELRPARVVHRAKPAKPAPAPATGFAPRRYEGTAGALNYRLHVPKDAQPGMPLIVMLHGCTQSAEDFARGTAMNRLADAHGFLVAYPEQSQAANVQKCWNWFKPGDQQRDRGEPALIAGATREIIAAHGVDPARVYVAGLSAGGAAAAIMGACYPDLYAAIGIHSGLACGAARDVMGALQAMKQGPATAAAGGRFVPVITFHGDRDATVHEVNSQRITAAAREAAGPLETRTETGTGAGGRRYTRALSCEPGGRALIEQWTVHGAGHAWSGGDPAGSHADPHGPDASAAMLRFFLDHRLAD